jgi:hypothetical protein
MKIKWRLSLGGKILILHYAAVAILWLLLFLFPQPQASITDGNHWFWAFLQSCQTALLWITLPVSRFMAYGVGTPFALWTNERMFVPLSFVLALNSLIVGYTIQFLVSLVRYMLHGQRDHEVVV